MLGRFPCLVMAAALLHSASPAHAALDDDLALCAGDAQHALRLVAVENATRPVPELRGGIGRSDLRAVVLDATPDGETLRVTLGLSRGELVVGQEGKIGERQVIVTDTFGSYARARTDGAAVVPGAIAIFPLDKPWVAPGDIVAHRLGPYAVPPGEGRADVEEINKAGGLPTIDFASGKVSRIPTGAEPDGLVWNPRVLPDDFIRGVLARVLDLEQNGSRYVAFGVLATSATEITLIWARTGKRWAQIFRVPGALTDLRAGAVPSLVFSDAASQSRVAFDPRTRRFNPLCSIELGMIGANTRVVWPSVAAPIRPISVRPGPTPAMWSLSTNSADAKVPRGARGWVLASRNDEAQVALILPIPTGFKGRSLKVGWLLESELQSR